MVVLSSVNQKCGQGDTLEIILSRKAFNHYSYLSSLLFPSIVTVQRGRVTVVLSTFCGRARMHVHSAPKTTTKRLSALASREYR